MKTLNFSEISLDDFAKIYTEINHLTRKDLQGETFFSGNHAEFGEITLYQPRGSNKAIMLKHDKRISETDFDIPEFSISLTA